MGQRDSDAAYFSGLMSLRGGTGLAVVPERSFSMDTLALSQPHEGQRYMR
jgi:hypothetical protein